ncbi:U-box domain-containing protein/Pkinase_Tyr domain-containing protein [Cephalotus follicularis]|uniref:RING-type E3 ubiquitin transferase n=1 Tax=Cephalotus follicularis TaxID=3775 RepID=A0A1Q3CNN4_CEPFO|nr:U-box domain-containing protein/Pkinase_Tyr domain-containing protein [Cephalotus follicularis]
MAMKFESKSSSSSSPSSSLARQDVDDDIVYVAVGKEVEESKPTLLWALQNFGGRVRILHVHHCPTTIPSTCRVGEQDYRISSERQKMNKILNDYLQICHQAEVHAEKLHIEMDDVGKGIVELIYQHSIKKLVMGAAANKHYSERTIKSEKAIYVQQHVPSFCKIWFICNGLLIYTGECNSDAFKVEVTSPSSVVETGPSNPRSPFQDSGHLGCSSSEVVDCSTLISRTSGEETIDQLINQLEAAFLEAEKSKREAYEESGKRVKAEKTTIEALRRARALENSYTEELRRRSNIEEALTKTKEDLQEMRKQQDEERLTSRDQKLLLENQVLSYEHRMKELHNEILSSTEKVEIYRKERDNLQIGYDAAIRRIELLRKQTEEASSSHTDQFLSEFSVSEIHKATRDFHSSMKIAEGGYGSIYQGSLRQTEVAIKVVHSSSLQGPLQFEQEVNLLSKLRHPNLVTLIGVCREIWALVYEYLPDGSLEDHLICKGDTPPLSWQTRICIAIGLCSVLIFLHSSNPCVVHGNLKPGNILLDAKFACKLSDFGICRALSMRGNLNNGTNPHEAFPYMDPQFLATGELSPKSDIYSFGIILLQLLTGRSPLNMANDVSNAVDQNNLNSLLDPLAGNWPFVQALQLARLGLRCCSMNRSRRPDLVSEVWDVLKRMGDSCESPSSFQPTTEDHSQAPSYFICPILQDVMEDPHVAADGFTYELEEIRGWLSSGHDTSPMTNLRLSNGNLVPNRALRSAIQDWRKRYPNVQN